MFIIRNKKSHKYFSGTQKVFFLLLIILYSTFLVQAETVSGNGYILNQNIIPIQGGVSGNGYSVEQSGQTISNTVSGGGYNAQPVFGSSVSPTVIPPPVSSGGSGGITSGGGYYIMLPATNTTIVSSTSQPVNNNTLLTGNGSTCSTRIVITSPIDTTGTVNNKDDVKKLETFLNTYEGERLKVNGIYEKVDIVAVKKWQQKYKTLILTPMRIKNPTGTIYTLSMRQIERQSTASCGQAVLVHACPFFSTYASYGDTGGEVKKIQQFLNIVQGEKLPLNGKYGPATSDAIKRFQRKYKKEIVDFKSLSFISGNWNITTRMKANQVIGCDILK